MIALGGDSKLLHRILKLIKYANLCTFLKNHKNCFFFAISYPILILFALYDSTRRGIQNFYKEFWNSFNMLIYAHFSKITSSSFIDLHVFHFFFLPSERLSCGALNLYTEFWHHSKPNQFIVMSSLTFWPSLMKFHEVILELSHKRTKSSWKRALPPPLPPPAMRYQSKPN